MAIRAACRSSGFGEAKCIVFAIPFDDAADEILPDRKELLDLACVLTRLHPRHIFSAHDDKIDLGPRLESLLDVFSELAVTWSLPAAG